MYAFFSSPQSRLNFCWRCLSEQSEQEETEIGSMLLRNCPAAGNHFQGWKVTGVQLSLMFDVRTSSATNLQSLVEESSIATRPRTRMAGGLICVAATWRRAGTLTWPKAIKRPTSRTTSG